MSSLVSRLAPLGAARIYLYAQNVDMRKSFDGLHAIIQSEFPSDALGGNLFLDVWVYIKDVLDQLLAGSTDYQSLLPDVWKQKHPEAVRDYRVAERRDKAERKQVAAAKRRFARPKH